MFFCEFREILKNNFFTEHRATASEILYVNTYSKWWNEKKMIYIFTCLRILFWYAELKIHYQQLILYKKTNEWYIKWQRVYNERQRELQGVTTRENEWQWVTTNDNGLLLRLIFPFFEQERNIITKHSNENPLNIEKDLLNWIKSRNKPLRKNTNSKKKELRQLFLFKDRMIQT